MDTETGLYYLMSRYYDPVTHRFVNANGYFQSGGDILDINMNVYCRNNPVNYFDYTGTIVFSVGSSLNAVFGFGEYVSVNYLIDDNGNIAKQITYIDYPNNVYLGGVGAGANKSVSVVWDADTVFDMENDTFTMGASVGDVASFGIDLIELEESGMMNGVSLSAGVGAGVDVHEYTSTTKKLWTINLNDIFSSNNTIQKQLIM